MAKHKPGMIWALRRPGQYPNGYVATVSADLILISYDGNGFRVSRRDARLLVRRILQCLEETR